MNPAFAAAISGTQASVLAAAAASGFAFANAEAAAVAAAMTNPPDDARKQLIDDLVGALKNGATSGSDIWAKLDFLWVLAAADSQASLLDWTGNGYGLTANDAPTFTADRGWNGDGATAGMNLSSAFVPSTSGGHWTLNAAHLGAFNLAGATGATAGTGVGTALSISATGGSVSLNQGFSGAAFPPTGAPPDHVCGSRTASNVLTAYRNGVAGTPVSTSASGLAATALLVLASAAGGASSAAQVAMVHGGAGLSAAEVLDVYNAAFAYLHAIGAV